MRIGVHFRPEPSFALAALYCFTLFWTAALLFWVEPMVGKMFLPILGGSPAVWNTCLAFFQAMMLLGYAGAHWMTLYLRWRQQFFVQFFLIILAFVRLPFRLNEIATLPTQGSPTGWLLAQLTLGVGPAFFSLATLAPLLQRWFSYSSTGPARNPYFLYAASNLGSFTALLSYPVFVESNLNLRTQSYFWAIGLAVAGGLILVCGWAHRRRGDEPQGVASSQRDGGAVGEFRQTPAVVSPITLRRKLKWAAGAAVPSSLLLGVTSFVTTDLASMPLLWVIPLALYLLTFVLVFGRRTLFLDDRLDRALPIGVLALLYQMCSSLSEPAWLVLSLHLVVFFVAAMVAHGRLARDRPGPEQLTEFYLWLSLGGVVGGWFNALLAPIIFNSVTEYPLALAIACTLCVRERGLETGAAYNEEIPGSTETKLFWRPCLALMGWPLAIFGVTSVLGALVPGRLSVALETAVIFGVPLVLTFLLVDRPTRFALGLVAVFLGSSFYTGGYGKRLHGERNFFGVTRIVLSPDGKARQIVHGRTIHGRQYLDPLRANEPLTFYHRAGPVGDLFAIFSHQRIHQSIGVIGLGAGTMAAYAQPGERWTFYEIDPSVIRLAQNTNYFTFLNRSLAPVRIIEGDARLRLQEAPEGDYDLLVLDAFSSDAIPIHLLTEEALTLYLRKLAPGGLLAFHISNRYLGLEPVLANLAKKLRLEAISGDDNNLSEADFVSGRERSQWVVMARRPDELAGFRRKFRWFAAESNPGVGLWTDDFSSPIKVVQW